MKRMVKPPIATTIVLLFALCGLARAQNSPYWNGYDDRALEDRARAFDQQLQEQQRAFDEEQERDFQQHLRDEQAQSLRDEQALTPGDASQPPADDSESDQDSE
jgi:hypothetical protein